MILVDVLVFVVDDVGSFGFFVVFGLFDDVGSLVVEVVVGCCVLLVGWVKDVDCWDVVVDVGGLIVILVEVDVGVDVYGMKEVVLRDWLKVYELDVFEFWLKVVLIGVWDVGFIEFVFFVFLFLLVVIGEGGINVVVVVDML